MITVLFLLSGFPALLYQIVWQRALFAIYGVNVESVTMVVTAFMLGLGLGSLAGGRLSQRPGAPLLAIFGCAELGIAAFGLLSLRLFHWTAAFTAGAAPLAAGGLTFALVLLPTLLMGATLPLLTAHWVRRSGNVGRSVGILYFVNTLGSAAACFAAAAFTMPSLGMSGTVRLAAAINILVGVLVLGIGRRTPAAPPAEARPAAGLAAFPAALLLAALAGFISLGYEIVWYRAYAFASGARPRSFAFVLGAFLTGIAFGSLLSRSLCRESSVGNTPVLLRRIGWLVLAANLLGFVSVPLLAFAVRYVAYPFTLPLIALAAGLLAATFPLLCHASIPPDAHAGGALGKLYLANIAGSALGSFVIGMFLMDWMPLHKIQSLLAALGVAASMSLLWAGGARKALPVAGILVAAISMSRAPLFDGVYEQLQRKAAYAPGERFTDVVETRSGVVTVDAQRTIYGDGAYDGYLDTDVRESDTVIRPLSISYFHAAPKEVLIIGASGGAWTQVVGNHPRVERLDVVEINPGYVTVMRRYPVVAPLLSNPKVHLEIDDGRRWLARHPERRYDMILMDTTYHWRAHATNLLSAEFLEMARRHLKPGGVLYYNTTHSFDAQLTGASVFPHVFRFGPFLAASDSPLDLDRERWRRTLLAYRLDGKPILDDANSRDAERLEEILSFTEDLDEEEYDRWGMETGESVRRRNRGRRIITDDNMACEWR